VRKNSKESTSDVLRDCQKDYDRIKPAILDLGFICTGSLTERWLTCGNPNCRCHKDRSKGHGPYFQLSWKEKGKTLSRFIPPEVAEIYREWIQNRRSLDQIISQMHAISETAQKCILPPQKSKKLPARSPKKPS
jgi:hypothetical protein